jgi:hypothetical protein
MKRKKDNLENLKMWYNVLMPKSKNYKLGAIKRSLGIKKPGVLPPGTLLSASKGPKLTKKKLAIMGLV